MSKFSNSFTILPSLFSIHHSQCRWILFEMISVFFNDTTTTKYGNNIVLSTLALYNESKMLECFYTKSIVLNYYLYVSYYFTITLKY